MLVMAQWERVIGGRDSSLLEKSRLGFCFPKFAYTGVLQADLRTGRLRVNRNIIVMMITADLSELIPKGYENL